MKILHITNFASREILDGGVNREEALAAFLSARGSVRLIVQDARFKRDQVGRLLRLRRLMREIDLVAPEIVVLNYPAYPFFWQHTVTKYYKMSLAFTRRLRRWANSHGAQVIIDVMDLPLYQYEDVGLPMDMSTEDFRAFDQKVLGSADRLWVCSHHLSELTTEQYGVPSERICSVVNGSNACFATTDPTKQGPFKFVYCGSLLKHRGVEQMIRDFVDCRLENVELHLAGADGDWIPGAFSNSGIVYHGSLTDSAACELAAKCEVGCIYYPQKGYYHLAFATKLALYVCCGVPVLCTDVAETGGAVRAMGVGRVVDIADYGRGMREMASDPATRKSYETALRAAAAKLSWNAIYADAWESSGLEEQGS